MADGLIVHSSKPFTSQWTAGGDGCRGMAPFVQLLSVRVPVIVIAERGTVGRKNTARSWTGPLAALWRRFVRAWMVLILVELCSGRRNRVGIKGSLWQTAILRRDSDYKKIIRRVWKLRVASPQAQYRGLNVSRNLHETVVVSSQIRTAA